MLASSLKMKMDAAAAPSFLSTPPPPSPASPPAPRPDCVKFEHVVRAHHRCRQYLVNTNLMDSHWLSQETGSRIVLKLEQQQFTGSFKERGACNALLSLGEEARRAGVKAASAGNHALALSYHGANLAVPVTVVMPTVAPLAKVDKCRALGANVIVHGAHIGEAKEHAMSGAAFGEMTYINGYDDPVRRGNEGSNPTRRAEAWRVKSAAHPLLRAHPPRGRRSSRARARWASRCWSARPTSTRSSCPWAARG